MMSEAALRAPYPGLRAFRRSETELFFGRDGCINAMVDRLAATHFLAVLGSSGTGKSSLVRAGLLDGLELGLMGQAGSHWCIVEFRPEGDPLRNLARRLLQIEEPRAEHTDADVNLLRAFIARGPRSVAQWCGAGHLSKGRNLLLLVDQFEELFRYHDYTGREEAEAFVALLIESAHTREFPIYVAITMRSEYLGACAQIDGLADEINAGMYLAPRMTREQCREAIVGPARVCDIEIDDALVNRLLNDLSSFAPWDEGDTLRQETRPVDSFRRADQLPLLQYTLNRMWLNACERSGPENVRLTLGDYQGLSFTLNEHADQIFHHLDSTSCPVEKVFRALTAGTSVADAVRQPTRLDRLVAICDGDESGVRKVIEAYRASDCNFLLPEADPDKPLGPATVIDISHESLIRQWRRLSDWLEAEAFAAQQWRTLNERFNLGELLHGRELANMLAWRGEVKPNAAWARRYGGDYSAVEAFLDRSERAESRRRRLHRCTAAGISAILLTTAAVAGYEWHRAQLSLADAQVQQRRAEKSYGVAKVVLEDLTLSFVEGAASHMPIAEVTDLFRKTKATLDKLTLADPNDTELQGIKARLLDKFVDVYQQTNHYFAPALEAANQANDLFRRLARSEPGNTVWPGLLAENLNKIGDLKRIISPKDAKGARASYDEALALDRRLAALEPDREDHPRQIAIELVKIGDMQLQQWEKAAAVKSYNDALQVRSKLVEEYFLLPIYHRDLSTIYTKLADLESHSNDMRGAIADYQNSLRVDRQITTLPFGTTGFDQENISIDLDRIGETQVKLGDFKNGRKSFDESLENDRRMARGGYDKLELQRRMSKTLFEIADLQLGTGDIAGARRSYSEAFAANQQSINILAAAQNSGSMNDYWDAVDATAWSGILAGKPDQVTKLAEDGLKMDPSQVRLDIRRAHAYLLLGRYEEAKAIYLAREKVPLKPHRIQTFAHVIKADFAVLRRLGVAVSDIDRMAREIGIAKT
jgi:tetratricopeptide (TPR) repeat protein